MRWLLFLSACGTAWGIPPPSRLQFAVKPGEITKQDKKDVERWNFSNGEYALVHFMGKKSKRESARLIAEAEENLRILTGPRNEPYFGKEEPTPTCDPKVRPASFKTKTKNEERVGFHLFATERGQYGACIPEQDTRKSQALYVHCLRDGSLFEVKYYYPATQPWKKVAAASCVSGDGP